MRWIGLISENGKNLSIGRIWLNVLLIISCILWLRDKDIPVGLGSVITTLLVYNFGKKLKFVKNNSFTVNEDSKTGG